MLIHRTYKGQTIEITLKHAELEKAHAICQKMDFELDFVNRYKERYADGTGLCNLPAHNMEEQKELLEQAYSYYQDIQDCNVAFNDTMDAVIDKMEQQMKMGGIALVKQSKNTHIVVIIHDGIISAAYSSNRDVELEIVELDKNYADTEQCNAVYEVYTRDTSLTPCEYSLTVPGYGESIDLEVQE